MMKNIFGCRQVMPIEIIWRGKLKWLGPQKILNFNAFYKLLQSSVKFAQWQTEELWTPPEKVTYVYWISIPYQQLWDSALRYNSVCKCENGIFLSKLLVYVTWAKTCLVLIRYLNSLPDVRKNVGQFDYYLELTYMHDNLNAYLSFIGISIAVGKIAY